MDLYSDLDGDTNNGNGKHEEMESVDLYEDVLLPTVGGPAARRQAATMSAGDGSNRKYQLYIGNLTWWTSDRDIANAVAGLGIRDLLDVKFFEYRPNGQSKGYCVVTFGSEQSVPACMQGLPKVLLHGNNPVVTYPTKQALLQFEAGCKPRPTPANPTPQQQMMAVNSAVLAPLGNTGIPPPRPINSLSLPPHWQGSPHRHAPPRPPSLLLPRQHPPLEPRGHPRHEWNRPPPPHPPVVHSFPPQGVPVHRPPPSFPPPLSAAALGSTGPRIGSPFFPRGSPHSMASGEPLPRVAPPGYNTPPHNRPNGCPPSAPPQQVYTPVAAPMKDANYEEIMARNRTVTSSAIARAVSDAATGEFASAIETLVTAISLIKHSETAKDERCRVLVSSLQDTLQNIETKSYGGVSRRERSRSRERERLHKRYRRDRSRSRERDYRDKSRDRERERDRERYYYDNYYRDRSRSRDREREREYRERSKEDKYDDRYRERERERERDRDREREIARKESDREREREREPPSRRESEREREPSRRDSERERDVSRRELDRERETSRRELEREREPRREMERERESRRELEREREPSRRELEREREPSKREVERERETSRREPEKEMSRRDIDAEREPSSRETDKEQVRREGEKESSRRDPSRRELERDRDQSRRDVEWERESRRESVREASRRESERDREPSRRDLERERERDKYYKVTDKDETFLRESKQV